MIDKILKALEPYGIRQTGPTSWRSRCPCHEGESDDVLKLDLNPEGIALFRCHGGCATKEILASIGLTPRDLFSDKSPPARILDAEKRKRANDEKRKHAKAAAKAGMIWNNATPVRPDHGYLSAKGVDPVETLREIPIETLSKFLRYRPKGRDGEPLTGRILVIPLKIDGKLSTLEFIDETGRKSALAGGAKGGGYWSVEKLPEGDGAGITLLLAEGLATVLSARKATGYPAIAAFGCTNLEPVALYLRGLFPKAQLVILSDLGNGESSARAAAQAVNARLAVPVIPEGKGTDYNDLARQQGIEAVKDAITSAIEQPADNGQADDSVKAENPAERDSGPFRLIEYQDGFRNGVYFVEKGEDGETLPPIFICSPLNILARTRDTDNESWGILLEWKDPEGKVHSWAMPSRMLSGTGEEYRSQLLDGGLEIAPGTKARNHLGTYLLSARNDKLARCTERTGWHDGQFVLPDRVIGNGKEQVVFQSVGHHAAHYGEAGTLDDWKREIAAPCIGNSRLVFAVSSSFAAPTLEIVGDENGGVHLQGGTSIGKTTALRVAASVFGPREYLHRWRATANGLESVATCHSGTLLILDEMGQIDAREAGEIAYLLANGTGKHRATRTGGARKAQSWRLLFLSSGETDLAQHMLAAGKKAKAGQEIRLLSFDADAEKGFGAFEHLAGFPSGKALSDALMSRSSRFYGTAGPAFIEALSQELDDIPRQVDIFRKVFLDKYLPNNASGQVGRAAARFALIGAAGELATECGITGWKRGEAENAAATCFKAWLDGRGGAGDREVQSVLAQVLRFFEAHGESRFHNWSAPDERPVINRAGVRQREGGEQVFYVLPETYNQEICVGYAPKFVSRVLEENGILETEKNRSTVRENLPGIGRVRCYKVTPFKSTDC